MTEAATDGAQTPTDAPDASEAPDTTEAPETAATDADSHPDADGDGDREAAKYRRRLRDAEAERDQLAERLNAMQRVEAERLAAQHLADPTDLWRDGLELAELLGDDGLIDAGKVADAARATTAQHPHWTKPQPRHPAPGRGAGLRSGASNPADHRGSSWQQVLRDAVHGR
ncbi:MAG: hypothetical protein ACRDTV_06320 [Mycobacterium sp.]